MTLQVCFKNKMTVCGLEVNEGDLCLYSLVEIILEKPLNQKNKKKMKHFPVEFIGSVTSTGLGHSQLQKKDDYQGYPHWPMAVG